MRTASNYGVIFSPDAPLQEQDSFTCYHCNTVHVVKPGQKGEDIGGLCKCCMQLICSACVDRGLCDPFEKKLERTEAKDRFLRQVGV